jgi:hypothetical protein
MESTVNASAAATLQTLPALRQELHVKVVSVTVTVQCEHRLIAGQIQSVAAATGKKFHALFGLTGVYFKTQRKLPVTFDELWTEHRRDRGRLEF